jgi:hypothetical protein
VDPRLVQQWERMRDRRERMIAHVTGASAERRERRPTPTSWALVDVLEHCLLVEEGVTTALATDPVPDKPRQLGKGGKAPWWVVRFVLIANIRIKAPVERILPKRESTLHDLTERWQRQRSTLEAWLEAQPGTVISAPRFRHPLAGWLDVPQALTFVADHLGHHLAQLARIERTLSA